MDNTFKKDVRDFGFENTYGLFYGSYRGFVADNEDPKFLGRVMLRVPSVFGDPQAVHEYWAPSRGIYAGMGVGFFVIPRVGEMVWVTFEMGDPNKPIWEYGHYALTPDGKTGVPEAAKNNGNKPTNQLYQSVSGHRLEFDDHNELIRITSKQGDTFEMNKNGVSVTSAHISLGKLDKSKEKGVLGDTLKAKLDALCDQLTSLCDGLAALTVNTAMGPSTVPINLATFTGIKTTISQIKGQLPDTLSGVVTLE